MSKIAGPKPDPNAAAFASKRERQAAWDSYCRSKGWSDEQCNRAASIIPHGMPIKVLRWPKL